jgi:hypothetical protein
MVTSERISAFDRSRAPPVRAKTQHDANMKWRLLRMEQAIESAPWEADVLT